MNQEEQKIYKLVRQNLAFSYAPYSKFAVSAAVVTQSGKVVTGVNVENSSYPCGICAERVALFNYVSQGLIKDPIRFLMISGNTPQPISPCGACRQVMSEFMGPEAQILLTDKDPDQIKRMTLKQLLPYYFTSEDLKNGQSK